MLGTYSRLTKQEALDLYRTQVVQDFDENEIKPEETIRRLLDDGIYFCEGTTDEKGKVLAYAYLLETDGILFLDYFAVLQAFRGKHYGTELLKTVIRKTKMPILFEVEDPKMANSQEEAEKMEKRIRFYVFVGARRSDVQVSAFGHPYILMTVNQDEKDRKTLTDQYRMIYRTILKERMERYICIND